jgi:glycosyltransferase involved in cell wall biosynthesis
MVEEKPLITFALFSYNQEKYVREAVAGALAQTYSPLQIILSDDCSSDSTFTIMSQMAAEYQGPHQILLNRNEPNRGWAEHINYVMTLVKGDLIVVAAGDDISLPERTESITHEWLTSGKSSKLIHSAYIEMDADGTSLQLKQSRNIDKFNNNRQCINDGTNVIGATQAWSSELFSIFGPIRSDVIHEDCAMPLRAMLVGKVAYIEIPLIRYRINVGISSGFGRGGLYEELYGTGAVAADRYHIDYLQKLQDLKKINAIPALVKACEKRLQEQWLLKALGYKEDAPLRLFFRAIQRGAGLWAASNITTKYMFPRTTIFKRRLAIVVRKYLGLTRK